MSWFVLYGGYRNVLRFVGHTLNCKMRSNFLEDVQHEDGNLAMWCAMGRSQKKFNN
jgi:hypothetical protein